MINEALRPFLNDLLREHRQLHQLAQALSHRLAQGQQCGWTAAAAREAGTALCQLRGCAHQHFEHEECDGCFEDAIANLPACAPRVDALRGEHAELLAALDRFHSAAHLDDQQPEFWRLYAGQIEELLAHLADHERREARLIAEVFNVAPDDV